MKNSELIGVFLGADYVFDNGPDRRCVVGSVRLLDKSIVTVRGYANETELSDNVTYRFYGHNRNHPKYGTQFNFNSFVEEDPVDVLLREAAVLELGSTRALQNVDQGRRARVWRRGRR